MKARLVEFGVIEVEGQRYEHDLVLVGGVVSKRRKGSSKKYRDRFGHTPLSPDEDLPWQGSQLVIGTGANGALPVMPEVTAEARRRGVELVIVPTRQACELLEGRDRHTVYAVLHVTC